LLAYFNAAIKFVGVITIYFLAFLQRAAMLTLQALY